MKDASKYPVTYKFGYSKAYGGYHTGEDRPTPYGTPLVINGVKVGETGNSGYVLPAPTKQNPKNGSHLHISKLIYGALVDPSNGGFSFKSAVVTQISVDGRNGRFIRVQGDGADYVYCHLSKVTCKVGQKLRVKAPLPIPTRKFYKVKSGDTATAIARKYKLTIKQFAKKNPKIVNLDWIYPGQKVRVR